MNDLIDIRQARIEDFRSIYLLNKHSMGYDFDESLTEKRLQKILSLPSNRIFVALLENKVVGYIHIADYDCTYAPPLKNVLAIAVDEGSQGSGIGRALLAAAENCALEDGCAGVRLVSGYDRTGAHKFYLACGYTLRKEQKNFIKYL